MATTQLCDKNSINVFQYWGQGIRKMPLFLKIIYKYNLDFCKKNNINLILIDDNNVTDYITPHPRFKKLAYHFKSDIIRYYILHKYGGFWFDTDVIIIKDINNLYESIKNYECMLDVEYDEQIGCASLFIKKQSVVSNFCINYINNILNKNIKLTWGTIGPITVEMLYKNHKSLIWLNNYETVKNGCNFICWNKDPGINKEDWYLKTEKLSKSKADFLKNNSSCYYLITWTIYRINDMGTKLNNMVFNDKRSVFSYFVNYGKDKIIVKNSIVSEWNGEYIKGKVKWKDNATISYIKDDKHHIYKYNSLWRLGENGVKVYKKLGNKIDNVIDLKDKYVLCCPINGLNDTFNQIMKCYNYCKKTGRTLLVNTNVNHNQSMRYNFSDYFHFKDTDVNIISDTNEISNLLKKQNFTVINNLNNYLGNNYLTEFIGKESDGTNILCDKDTKIPLKFDFSKDYDEDVLIHFQGGQCNIGGLLFNYIFLNKNLEEYVKSKINTLPKNYTSFYVRNTDKKSNYKKLLYDNFKIIKNKNIYLATDCKSVINWYRNINSKIYNFTTFPDENSKNLHNSNVNTKTKIYDAVTDLYVMGKSDKIITNSNSGYLNLGNYLFENKKFISNILTPKKYFLTFAGGNYFHYQNELTKSYYDAAERIIIQAKNTKCFDDHILYTDNDLKKDDSFWNKHKKFISNNKKGYGYWLWKSYIIKKTIEEVEEGDILLYCDAGCEIDSSKHSTIKKYFEIVKKDLIIGTLTNNNSKSQYYGIEKNWVKRDLVKKLNMDKPEYLDSLQRQATCLMFYVCSETKEFINNWYDLCCNYHLIDDSPSIEKNIINFKQHRHDQAIFSLLSKKYNLFSNQILSEFVLLSRNKTGISLISKSKYAVMWASTVNIGDDIQTLAAINFLRKKGITEYSFIDREKLSDYDGEPVTLIMNGWFIHKIKKFPPSDKITPVFISVHICHEKLISNNINYFKKYEPIGCRDEATIKKFKKYNINAYFTGCLTLLFDDVKEKNGR